MDEFLSQCNETELLHIAKAQGLGRIRRGLPRKTLEGIVAGEFFPSPDHLCGTSITRAKLEAYIRDHFAIVRSQLPGCTGRCTEYPCSDGRHALCFRSENESIVRLG